MRVKEGNAPMKMPPPELAAAGPGILAAQNFSN
jgi:hypothetical protein